jgi:hypothetical protein
MSKIRDKIFSYRKYFLFLNLLLGTAAVVIPPGLVFYHRWLMHPEFHDVFYRAWRTTPFLEDISLPTYFLIIFPLFLLSIYTFGLLAILYKANLLEPEKGIVKKEKPAGDIPTWQRVTSTVLFIVAGICLIADMGQSILWIRPSGIELLGVALLYIFALLLKEIRLTGPIPFLKQHAAWVVAYVAVYSAVLIILQRLFGEKAHQSGIVVVFLVFLLAVITIRWYRKIPVILWVSLVALILYTWGIDSWQFSTIGDEHDFYRYAVYILTTPLTEIGRNFFNTVGVFGTHTYLVSLVQVGFMKLFGASNFGWRITNPVTLSAAVVCFYLFFRKFTKQHVALVICGLLACSGFLMNFGKIGYDNPQAFFMLGITLWLAAEAVFSRRPVVYAILGLAMGFCLYSYPAALYVLPLPVILMAIFDFPKSKAAIWRWLLWIGIFSILAMPLLFQPTYGQGKVEGLYVSNLDSIAKYGIGFMFSSQLLYSLFSYLYIINESHFVTVSHIDPISAIWVPVGLAWITVQIRRNKFALFWMISFGVMLFLVGASHGRLFPPNTRMFMLLPWWTSFTAFGITWMADRISQKTKNPFHFQAILAAMMIFILATNLVHVTRVYPRLSEGSSSLEVLFMRLAERNDHGPYARYPIYVFVTDESWGIDGIRTLQDLYHSPQSTMQLERIVMTGEPLTREQLLRLQAGNTIIIPQPWMNAEWLASMMQIMAATGKVTCQVRETVNSPVKFTAYFPASLSYLCPYDGNWSN